MSLEVELYHLFKRSDRQLIRVLTTLVRNLSQMREKGERKKRTISNDLLAVNNEMVILWI
jgi:hypothetical protein